MVFAHRSQKRRRSADKTARCASVILTGWMKRQWTTTHLIQHSECPGAVCNHLRCESRLAFEGIGRQAHIQSKGTAERENRPRQPLEMSKDHPPRQTLISRGRVLRKSIEEIPTTQGEDAQRMPVPGQAAFSAHQSTASTGWNGNLAIGGKQFAVGSRKEHSCTGLCPEHCKGG